MDAVAIRRGETTPTVLDIERPAPGPGEALVRTLRVGVDGTDAEVIAGSHGSFPDGDDYLVLGHEAVGLVERAPEDSDLEPGDAVVPTIRRPPASGPNEYFEHGEADMAPPEACVERGIDGAHGFMSEFFTSPVETLVRIPRELAAWGFLVEPLSVNEKAFDLATTSRSGFDWNPESAFVLGNGSLGLLALAQLDQRGFERLYCLGRRDRPDPTIDVAEAIGATYVDSRETPVDAMPDAHEHVDLILEATGYAKHAFESIEALAPNGVAALLGLPESWAFEIDGGHLHKELVMTNKALVGSVNANRRHFAAAVDALDSLPEWLLADLVTAIHDVDDYGAAFAARTDGGNREQIKTAVQFAEP